MKDQRSEAHQIIENYTNNWFGYEFDDSTWNKPIAEGKASVAEIIGHLLNWDNYLIETVIPTVKNGGGMEFPDFDTFNKAGYAYVKNKPRSLILQEFNSAREKLSEMLLNSLEFIDKPTTSNGVSVCPHTGRPYSLIYIIEEFIEHDEHHKSQINAVITR
ncbi:DinB family protein [Cohnella faecalis]|uniref:DinB family protein n=1 Tax=Cohnella faecalis TaxID=2315694 RepID=A0A398CM96_9BACL|nr:DinB family protein [Cohnella faecalis]RIE03382.1 DinB family protein [Cohnella faecalis]